MSSRHELLYAASHERARIEGDEAVVGITFFAQDQLGDLTYVDLPKTGQTLAAGQQMGAVESVKAASDIYSPVSGTVIAINETLNAAPEIINKSPYDEGWIVRIKLSAQPDGLLSAAEYEKRIAAGQ
jgi:glycine cleavage system H protein